MTVAGTKGTDGTSSSTFRPAAVKTTQTGIPITKTFTHSTNVWEVVLPMLTVNGVSASVTMGSNERGEPASAWWVGHL